VDDVDYEERLLRSVMIRRLVFGVGAISMGICALLVTLLGLYLTLFTSAFAFSRPPLRFIALSGVLGGGLIVAGGVTLWRGEIDLDTGAVHAGEPVPVKMVSGATALIVCVVSAIAAWPLGVYDWIGGRFSTCHALLTLDELSELAGTELTEGELTQSDSGLVCTRRLVHRGEALPAARIIVHEDHWAGGWDFNRRQVGRMDPVEDLGTEAVRGHDGGFHHVGVFLEPSGFWIQLRDDVFDEADVDALIAMLRQRTDRITPYEQ